MLSFPAKNKKKQSEEQKISEDKIIRNVPKLYQGIVKQLIAHLKDNTNVTWNNNGEMVVDSKSAPHTNIIVLVNRILYKVRHEVDPVERKALIEQH